MKSLCYTIKTCVLCLLDSVLFDIISSSIGISCISWIFARKWPYILQGPQLGILCRFLSLSAWIIVVSPVLMLIMWGSWLIVILHRDIIGLAVIMAGTALLLAFYSIMLWWRTQWQSSSMCFYTLFIFNYVFILSWKTYFSQFIHCRICMVSLSLQSLHPNSLKLILFDIKFHVKHVILLAFL